MIGKSAIGVETLATLRGYMGVAHPSFKRSSLNRQLKIFINYNYELYMLLEGNYYLVVNVLCVN